MWRPDVGAGIYAGMHAGRTIPPPPNGAKTLAADTPPLPPIHRHGPHTTDNAGRRRGVNRQRSSPQLGQTVSIGEQARIVRNLTRGKGRPEVWTSKDEGTESPSPPRRVGRGGAAGRVPWHAAGRGLPRRLDDSHGAPLVRKHSGRFDLVWDKSPRVSPRPPHDGVRPLSESPPPPPTLRSVAHEHDPRMMPQARQRFQMQRSPEGEIEDMSAMEFEDFVSKLRVTVVERAATIVRKSPSPEHRLGFATPRDMCDVHYVCRVGGGYVVLGYGRRCAQCGMAVDVDLSLFAKELPIETVREAVARVDESGPARRLTSMDLHDTVRWARKRTNELNRAVHTYVHSYDDAIAALEDFHEYIGSPAGHSVVTGDVGGILLEHVVNGVEPGAGSHTNHPSGSRSGSPAAGAAHGGFPDAATSALPHGGSTVMPLGVTVLPRRISSHALVLEADQALDNASSNEIRSLVAGGNDGSEIVAVVFDGVAKKWTLLFDSEGALNEATCQAKTAKWRHSVMKTKVFGGHRAMGADEARRVLFGKGCPDAVTFGWDADLDAWCATFATETDANAANQHVSASMDSSTSASMLTLLLEDQVIPSGSSAATVRRFLRHCGCPKHVALEQDDRNGWHVTFPTDAHGRAALSAIASATTPSPESYSFHLTNIPVLEEAGVGELTALFSDGNCPAPVATVHHPAVNSWHFTFATKESAVHANDFIHTAAFNGVPLHSDRRAVVISPPNGVWADNVHVLFEEGGPAVLSLFHEPATNEWTATFGSEEDARVAVHRLASAHNPFPTRLSAVVRDGMHTITPSDDITNGGLVPNSFRHPSRSLSEPPPPAPTERALMFEMRQALNSDGSMDSGNLNRAFRELRKAEQKHEAMLHRELARFLKEAAMASAWDLISVDAVDAELSDVVSEVLREFAARGVQIPTETIKSKKDNPVMHEVTVVENHPVVEKPIAPPPAVLEAVVESPVEVEPAVVDAVRESTPNPSPETPPPEEPPRGVTPPAEEEEQEEVEEEEEEEEEVVEKVVITDPDTGAKSVVQKVVTKKKIIRRQSVPQVVAATKDEPEPPVASSPRTTHSDALLEEVLAELINEVVSNEVFLAADEEYMMSSLNMEPTEPADAPSKRQLRVMPGVEPTAEEPDEEKQVVRRQRKAMAPLDLEPPPTEDAPDPIDFLRHFCILSDAKRAYYVRSFEAALDPGQTMLDEVMVSEVLKALTRTSGSLTVEEMRFLEEVLELCSCVSDNTGYMVGVEAFAVIAAFAEKIASLDDPMRDMIQQLDLPLMAKKMKRSKDYFYVIANDDGDIDEDELTVELNAGRIVHSENETIVEKMLTSEVGTVSFLDFLVYIPLFLNIDNDILTNPLSNDRRSLVVETTERRAREARRHNAAGSLSSQGNSGRTSTDKASI